MFERENMDKDKKAKTRWGEAYHNSKEAHDADDNSKNDSNNTSKYGKQYSKNEGYNANNK